MQPNRPALQWLANLSFRNERTSSHDRQDNEYRFRIYFCFLRLFLFTVSLFSLYAVWVVEVLQLQIQAMDPHSL
jgi:hypothetical protein